MNHRQGNTPMRRPMIASIYSVKAAIAFTSTIVGSVLAPGAALASGGLVLAPEPGILITLLIAFVLLVSPMNKMIFLPLFKVLDERAARIAGARQRAQHLEKDAEATMSRYRDAIRGAREGAEATRQSQLAETRSEQTAMTAEAKNEASSEIARARGEIEASLDEAREALRASSQEVAKIAAEQILGRALS